jgi:hypothetical protein
MSKALHKSKFQKIPNLYHTLFIIPKYHANHASKSNPQSTQKQRKISQSVGYKKEAVET